MAADILKRDANRITALGGVDETGAIRSFLVDPTTHRLLIHLTDVSDTAPASPTGKRDQNRIPNMYGVDETGAIRPILIDPRNGNVYCDILFEP